MQLATNILSPVDPSKFIIHYFDRKRNEFRSTNLIEYLTEVFDVINEFDPSILKKQENRKKVIDFVPLFYPSDFERLYKILGTL